MFTRELIESEQNTWLSSAHNKKKKICNVTKNFLENKDTYRDFYVTVKTKEKKIM